MLKVFFPKQSSIFSITCLCYVECLIPFNFVQQRKKSPINKYVNIKRLQKLFILRVFSQPRQGKKTRKENFISELSNNFSVNLFQGEKIQVNYKRLKTNHKANNYKLKTYIKITPVLKKWLGLKIFSEERVGIIIAIII